MLSSAMEAHALKSLSGVVVCSGSGALVDALLRVSLLWKAASSTPGPVKA